MEQWYDKEEDILNIELQEKPYWKSIEIATGVVADIARDGSIIALEIVGASKIFSGDLKKVLEAGKITA